MKNCPSKPFSLFTSLDWGLRDVKVTSPFSFSARKNGLEMSFKCVIMYHNNGMVMMKKYDEDYLLLLIPNKKGDNFIVLTKEDCEEQMEELVSFEWLAPRIKRKTRFEYETR